MVPKSKFVASQQPEIENPNFKHLTRKDFDVFETEIMVKKFEELKGTLFTNFSNSSEHLPTWDFVYWGK
jgi:hypothetical protein